MPQSTKEEKFRWIKPILDKEISIKRMSKVCPFSERSLKYWLAAFEKDGMGGLEPKSTRPHTHPNETPIRLKEKVIELRKKKKQCALKIMWDLQDEGIGMHFQTIQKIIKNDGLTRKYRTRKQNPNYIRASLKKGDMVEIDVKFVPEAIDGRRCYQFTAVDCASRWRYLQAYGEIDTVSALAFVKELVAVVNFKIKAIKTDNAAVFTNRYNGYYKSDLPFPRPHAFDKLCKEFGISHYLIDPGKPAQNGTVERSHRTDQEKFYDENEFISFEDLKAKMRSWNEEYNNTKHCGLNGKTPNQVLRS